MRRSCRALALLAGASVAIGGCGESADDAQTAAQTTAESGTRSTADRPLEDSWYEDPDGDGIPTHTELRIGSDPESDACVKDLGCPGVDEVTTVLRNEQPSNTLLMLDSSGSMGGSAGGGERKITAARQALERFVVGTPDSTKLGLLVYGHEGSNTPGGKAASCRGAEILAPLGKIDYRTAHRALARFKPRGYTPIARALRVAQQAFAGSDGERNRIVLVSDGVETCGGDPVATARRLKRAGIAVTVDVVGFDIKKSTDAARLKQIADVTDGTYTAARSGRELADFVKAESARLKMQNRAVGCILRKGNALTACQLRRVNDAAGDMLREQSAFSSDLLRQENSLASRLLERQKTASADGDREHADELTKRRQQMTKQLSDRRLRTTNEISRIRTDMQTRLDAERIRDQATADRRRMSIQRQSAEVERRLRRRYGRP